MKKKVLLTSIATIALCLCLIAGSSLALFTSERTNSIVVTAGNVDMDAELKNLALESTRALKDGGYLVVVGAGREHLMGLKTVIYDNPYENEGRADLPKNLTHIKTISSKYDTTVMGNANILALFSMTPYYWRTSQAGHERLALTDSLNTPVAFDFFVYKKI